MPPFEDQPVAPALVPDPAVPLPFKPLDRATMLRGAMTAVFGIAGAVGFIVWSAPKNGSGPGFWSIGLSVFVVMTVLNIVNRYAKSSVALDDEGLTINDVIGKKSFRSRILYSDIESLRAVPGKGVGLRLLQAGPWFDSFTDKGTGLKAWKARLEGNRKSKQVDVWFPDHLLGAESARFGALVQQRLIASPATAAEAGPLNLDTAEFPAGRAAVGAQCANCDKALAGEYWELNDQLHCPDCFHAQQAAQGRKEGRWGRFGRALWWGSLGSLAGAAVFAGVAIGSGYEIGLLSILAGYMGGAGVKRGSQGRGGWRYQTLAVALTYTAVTLAYVTIIGHAVYQDRQAKAEARQKARTEAAGSPVAGALPSGGQSLAVAATADAVSPSSKLSLEPAALAETFTVQAQAQLEAQVSKKAAQPWYLSLIDDVMDQKNVFLKMALGLVLAGGFFFALPFVIGFESPMALVIIGLGLWQAWSMNKRRPFVAKGPFFLTVQP